MSIYYPAILESGAEPGYSVFFPDLPGCTSAGDTQQEAAENAADALFLHLEGMLEDKLRLPAPSRLDDIKIDADVCEVGRVLIKCPDRKLERVNVSFDALLLARMDHLAKIRGQSRSEFLAGLARQAIALADA
jgi:predicted RNase H-like HicB family nuclease